MEKTDLKVLMISSDRQILSPESAVSKRMREYGELVRELHIVLLSDKRHGLREGRLSENVWVYPTNSISKFLRPIDAVRVGRAIDHNLITTQDPFECGWAGMKLKRLKNVPLEVQLHTDPFSVYFGGFLNSIRKLIAKRVIGKSNGIRVVTESLKRKIINQWPGSNVYVLPIYVDLDRISGEPKFNLHDKFGFKKIILMVSRLSPEKNLNMMLEVMPQIDKAAGLVIVGEGSVRHSLVRTAQKLGIQDRVKFEGWQEDLVSYYKTSDIFVQTSDFEGYGMSVLEAAMCGLPAISTPVGISNDLDSIIKVDGRDDLIKRINNLLKDDNERIELGKKLKESARYAVLVKEDFLKRMKENWQNLA